MEFRRSGFTEWYVNGPDGIEQGFTVESPPGGSSSAAPLTVRLAWGGEVLVSIEQNAAVASNLAGDLLFRYSGLSARDASGKNLPCRLEKQGSAILVRVDDKGAKYPVHLCWK